MAPDAAVNPQRDVLVTGGTGYIGSHLVERLLRRGHRVRVLTRVGSRARVVEGAVVAVGDALDSRSLEAAMRPGDTLVHLVGTPHPNPLQAAQFEAVDLASIRAVLQAAAAVRLAHLIYISVAQPAPVMHAYVAARAAGERAVEQAMLTTTIFRPWYVTGPGHRWPVVFAPLYALAERIPSLRDGALRLGLVTLEQMLQALVFAVENPPTHRSAILEVPQIRATRVR